MLLVQDVASDILASDIKFQETTMKSVASKRKAANKLLSAAFFMAASVSMSAYAKTPPVVSLPGYTFTEQEGNFLTFPDNSVPQNPTTANAYYKAIDPAGHKLTFQQWLVKAGFIGKESDWHPTGAQNIVTNQPGVYGDNIINADSHVIVINNADLGFIRNQFVRCDPSCSAKNPIIYTYLENYNYGALHTEPFGFPTQAQATAAITDAINNRRAFDGNNDTVGRIADVAFEWAPPPDGSSPNSRYGQLYAYLFHQDGAGNITETRNWPNDPAFLANLNSRTACTAAGCPPLSPLVAGDAFAPELDSLGFKQNPGVCFMCHGGNPKNLTSSGQYPGQGRSPGFKFLPLDNDNLLFTASGPYSRAAQEAQIKLYNQVVLLTQGASPLTSDLNGKWRVPTFTDSQGVFRTSHAVEALLGWYGGSVSNPAMPNATQNTAFIPVGWRDTANGGTLPLGTSALYHNTVARSCRACHSQRESDLDFGTAASFDAHKSDILEMVLQPECDSANPPAGKVLMPAAKRTFDRFWLENQDADLKTHFGYTATSYCAQHGASNLRFSIKHIFSSLKHPTIGKADK